MSAIRYIIIAKQCEVAGKSSILDGLRNPIKNPQKPFPQYTTSENDLFRHSLHSDDFPCNLTQFCYIIFPLTTVFTVVTEESPILLPSGCEQHEVFLFESI